MNETLTCAVMNQQTKGVNCPPQKRDTTTDTRIAYGDCTWHTSKSKVYNSTNRTFSKKSAPQGSISGTLGDTGVRHRKSTLVFNVRHYPSSLKTASAYVTLHQKTRYCYFFFCFVVVFRKLGFSGTDEY